MSASAKLPKELQTRLLVSVLEFLAMAGAPESSIRDSIEKGLARSRTFRNLAPKSKTDGLYQKSGDVSAQLLRIWHRDSRYVSSSSLSPRPLPLSKGRNSLRLLVEKIDPEVNSMEVLRNMRQVGLIQRIKDGRYLPTASATVIPRLHPWATEHAAKSVIRLVSTVFRNASREVDDPPLLERYSYVPDLSPEEGKAFAEFSRSQGQVYLDTIDDWLEQRRAKRSSSIRGQANRGVPAGVHVITYLGDRSDTSAVRSKLRKSRGSSSPRRLEGRATSPPATPA